MMKTEQNYYRALGVHLKTLRAKAGMSQENVAKLLLVTTNTISRWETGNYRPSLWDLHRLSDVYGVLLLDRVETGDFIRPCRSCGGSGHTRIR